MNYRAVANQFGVAVSTVCVIVKEAFIAIKDLLAPQLIAFPTSEADLLSCSQSFDRFPNCVGTIDESHIHIKRPKQYRTDFFTTGRDIILSCYKASVTGKKSS